MSPSAALRSRIEAFEPGKQIYNFEENSKHVPWILTNNAAHDSPMDSPLSPSAGALSFIRPSPIIRTPPRSRSRSPSPAALGRKTSLIDVSEIASIASSSPPLRAKPSIPPLPPRNTFSTSAPYPSPTSRKSSTSLELRTTDVGISRPLGNHETQAKAPPLPPRKVTSQDVITNPLSTAVSAHPTYRDRTISSSSTSSWYNVSQSPATPTQGPSFNLATIPLLEPRSASNLTTSRPSHAHANSTSSLQSVSLSDHGDDRKDDTQQEMRPPVLDNVSALNKIAGGNAFKVPYAPRIPPRSRESASPSASTPATPPPIRKPVPLINTSPPSYPPSPQTSQFSIRRIAPPPILPQATATSKPRPIPPPIDTSSFAVQIDKRRPPIPAPVRARYDAVFDRNIDDHSSISEELAAAQVEEKLIVTSPSQPSYSGWRGMSLDTAHVEKLERRLDGRVVKLIWTCSKLDRKLLRRIWSECDAGNQGSLDREEFARGMWRIDSELSKAAVMASRAARFGR